MRGPRPTNQREPDRQQRDEAADPTGEKPHRVQPPQPGDEDRVMSCTMSAVAE
jgi:hypothetical protein